MSTRLRVLCALTMLLALSAGAAQAHAYVVGAQPPMGGSNQQLAGQISISFDEPVDVLDSDAVQVFDATVHASTAMMPRSTGKTQPAYWSTCHKGSNRGCIRFVGAWYRPILTSLRASIKSG